MNMNDISIKQLKIASYGDYSNANYGINALQFTDGENIYWFSYQTLVAFQIAGEFHIIQNYWGSTTGKHLNWICTDKSMREDGEAFEANYKRCVREMYKAQESA